MSAKRRLVLLTWIISLALAAFSLALYYLGLLLQTDGVSADLLHAAIVRRAFYMAFLTPLFVIIAQRVPKEDDSPLRVALKLAACAFLVLIPYEVALRRLVFHMTTLQLGVNRLDMNLTIATFLVARACVAWETNRSLELRAARADAELSIANIRLLDSQLRPHFVFNALNGVLGLAYDDVGAAQRLVRSLKEFLAQSLDTAPMIPLGEELAIVGRYAEIERIRFGEGLQLPITAGADARSSLVPRMLLQPLVENAIRHGGGAIIDAELRGGRLCVEVINRGAASSETPRGEGIGLTNARARLEAAFGDAASLDIEHRPDGTTSVAISMPRLAA